MDDTNPDWKINLPDAYLLYVDPNLFNRTRDKVLETHASVMTVYEPVNDRVMICGWYGENKAESAAAIAELVQDLDAWRRGHGRKSKDSPGRVV